MTTVLTVDSVTKRLGFRVILKNVSFSLKRGTVMALMGPNGSGKSTMLRLVAGISRPTKGSVLVEGAVGMVAHQSMMYDALTAAENLAFHLRLHGRSGRTAVSGALELVGLKHRADDRVGTFSRGMLQRLAIARAVIHEPSLILLDEPLTGLDDRSSIATVELLQRLRGSGVSMLTVSHEAGLVSQLADRVGFLVEGVLVESIGVEGQAPEEIATRYREAVGR